jgi:hypothetical protein
MSDAVDCAMAVARLSAAEEDEDFRSIDGRLRIGLRE